MPLNKFNKKEKGCLKKAGKLLILIVSTPCRKQVSDSLEGNRKQRMRAEEEKADTGRRASTSRAGGPPCGRSYVGNSDGQHRGDPA